MREILDMLFRMERRCGLRLLVIGGWALQAHGYTRNTVDVDCLAALEDEADICDELGKSGFDCIETTPPFRRFRHRVDPSLVLDVMRVKKETFTKMWEGSQAFVLGDVTLQVPALPHLIALKLHAARNPHRSGKDMEDIRQLLAVNGGKISPQDLRRLCDQFGTKDSAQALQDYL